MSSLGMNGGSSSKNSSSRDAAGTSSSIRFAGGDEIDDMELQAAPSRRPMLTMMASESTKPPKKTLEAIYEAGRYKCSKTLDVLGLQAMMAGVYIGMAGQLYLTVGGGLLGATLFPTGLIAVVLTGAELFTGDAMVMVASVLGKHITPLQMLRNWFWAWVFNFVGCLLWAYFLSYLSRSFDDGGALEEEVVAVAEAKALQPWGVILLKGIGANFMVCLGVWQATTAEAVAGKVLAIWWPIMGFVAMKFDHCVANMYLISVGMMYGADISVYRFVVTALFPATVGNIIGGGVFMGALYWYVYDSAEKGQKLSKKIRKAADKEFAKKVEPIALTIDHSSPSRSSPATSNGMHSNQ